MSVRRRATRRSRVLGLAGLGTWLLLAAGAQASPREAVLDQLRDMERNWAGDDVRVLVEGGQDGLLRIGDVLVYRFRAQRAGYLTAIHVDTHGTATLLYPRSDAEAGRIGAAGELALPSEADGFELRVQPPVGRDVLYAIVTDQPLSRRELGISSSDLVVAYEPHHAADFVGRVRQALDARSDPSVRVAHVEQQIDGRGEVQYRSADIVGFFGERTRSIRPAKLDLQIHFETDSAELDEEARRNIDEFARALEDPKLVEMRFKVAGHTDDRGSVEHNLDLSRRRADTVRVYLIERGIEPDRLRIEAHGENAPLIDEVSDYARRMNRRVEFTPDR
jgi:outer membrane protein OmpA-like peptidoglycan-associated protein